MPPPRALLRTAVAGLVLVSACSGGSRARPSAPAPFCKAATRYDDRIQRGAGLDEQIRLVEQMAEAAPATIRGDARRFLDALRRVRTDPSVRDNPRVKRAVQNVNRFAATACGFYRQQNGVGI